MKNIRLLGHPIHPLLVHFPMALLGLTTLWDGLDYMKLGDSSLWSTIAYWNLVVGLIASLPTAAFGFIDFAGLDAEKEGRVGTWHMIVMLLAVSCYGTSLYFRHTLHFASDPIWHWLSPATALAGLGLLGLGGHLGGTLVYTLGVGVTHRAQ